jgi:hypothetical protein
MDSNQEITQTHSPTRRKFVWGVSALSAITAVTAVFGLPFFTKKGANPGNIKTMVKMLTEDGRLVEIDQSLITASKKKVTNRELQNWIKK